MNVMTAAPSTATSVRAHPETEWWRGAVIYQIYPRSFQDSNGDGIGDLAGITARLPYVASLGVDAIWISPVFKSPMRDYGYDISDHREIDPIFGQLSDFDALIAEAHRLGLKVIIDQVYSHTSDQHPWFKESRSGRDSAKADWFVWADPKPDGTPPNNWLSIFGGSAWQWDTMRCQYYLHNFLTSQPDLNLYNLAVQDALLDTARFWLDRGVDGFRLDALNFLFHSQGLEDNPALPPEERKGGDSPGVNPYGHQEHVFDKNRPEVVAFLRRLRTLLDEYPGTTTIGEIGEGRRALELMAEYSRGGDKIHMCYAFNFLSPELPTPARIRTMQERFEDKTADGWTCWSFSNHDVMRHATRWADRTSNREAFLRMVVTLLLSLKGSVCLYQGEELGLTEAELAFEDLQDPYGIEFWPSFKGRDGCRTPMVWQQDMPNAGFSHAKPWLPVPAEHLHMAVASQEADQNALLRYYRRMLAFRTDHPELVKGSIRFIGESDKGLAFERRLAGSTLLVAINMSEDAAILDIGERSCTPIKGFDRGGILSQGNLILQSFGCWFARLHDRGGR